MSREIAKEYQSIFTSAARTATAESTIVCNRSSGIFFINVTAVTATPSVVFTISGVDPISSATYTILQSAAITGTGLTVLRICTHLAAAANTIAKDLLPQALKITATHADADSITYSVSYMGTDT
jgi:hypothetical protein